MKISKNNHQSILIKYFINILINNKIIIALMIFNIASIIGIQFISWSDQEIYLLNFRTKSAIIMYVPSVLNTIFIAFLVIVLFVKTKKNNVDMYIYTKHFNNAGIVRAKQLSMFMFSSHILVGLVIGLGIRILIGMPSQAAFILLLGGFLSFFIMTLVWIFMFSFIAIHTKFFLSLLLIIFSSFIFISASIIPVLIANDNKISTSFDLKRNKNNLIKIYGIGNQNKVKGPTYALYKNPLGQTDNKIIGNKPSNFAKYSPFNVIQGLSSYFENWALKNQIPKEQLISSNLKFAFSNVLLKEQPLTLNDSNVNYLVAGLNEKTILDFASRENAFLDIIDELFKNQLIVKNVHKKEYWSLLQQELKIQNQWNPNIPVEEKIMLLHIMGLNSSTSILFSLFDKYDVLSFKTVGLRNYLVGKYNNEFADFLIYIWSNHNVKLNVYSYNTLGDFKDVFSYHPKLKTYDKLEKADRYDIEFIKNKLFNVVEKNKKITNIQMLNKDEIYEDISNFQSLFSKPVIDTNSFNEFIDKHATINNLTSFVRKSASRLKTESYKFDFRNNVDNSFVINSSVSIEEPNTQKHNWIFVLCFLIIGITMQYFTLRKVKEGDLI